MKLAFSGEGRYPDYDKGYELYVKRAKTDSYVDKKTYKRLIRKYCAELAEQLYENGFVQLPGDMGIISAALFERRPQYRGKKFIGYGKMDWEKGHYDGSSTAFGITFLPRLRKKDNLRCYGFVANRRLFKRMKERYESYHCPWTPVRFSDEMI